MNITPNNCNAYVIGLPTDNRFSHRTLFQHCFKKIEMVEGVIVPENDILWSSIRGLEAYNSIERFRSSYVPKALGCRLAGLKAIERGLEDGGDFFIFQDDIDVVDDFERIISDALSVFPENGDCLWLDDNQIGRESYFSPQLNRLYAARLCTGMFLRERYAREMIERLKKTNTEWDRFMEKEMHTHQYYISKSVIAWQREGISQITGTKKWHKKYGSFLSGIRKKIKRFIRTSLSR